MDARAVSCPHCHAELMDDRKTCPHCGTELTPAIEVFAQQAQDDAAKGMVQRVVKLEQENKHLNEQIVYLKGETVRLEGENSELRKRTGAEKAVAQEDK